MAAGPTTASASPAKAEPGETQEGARKKENRQSETTAAKPAKTGAQTKTRKLASETTLGNAKPATGEQDARGRRPRTEPANDEVAGRSAKPLRKSRQNGARETTRPSPTPTNASHQPGAAIPASTGEPAPDAKARSRRPARQSATKSPTRTAQPKSKRAAAASVESVRTGKLCSTSRPQNRSQLCRQDPPHPPPAKRSGKLARVSSVTGGLQTG